MNTLPRILVVDDEETLCEALRFNLEAAGFDVDTALSAEDALAMELSAYSLILLDIMMGDISGIQFASIIKKRSSTSHIPIIFCTARDSEDDMISGLELGADDYITKPYSVRNVIARIKSVLRRASAAKSPLDADVITYEGLTINTREKTCEVDGVPVTLPRKEFEIITLLLSDLGRIFTREEILNRVWRDEAIVTDRVIDVNISRLRSKLGRYGDNIITKSGYGYGFRT
ncbi:MAG: response regulator transcription factor [Muribaculaceae bacterium]